MPIPNQDPAVASVPPAGNLYFPATMSLAAKNHGEIIRGGGRSAPTGAQSLDTQAPKLMFGQNYTGGGEPIVQAANSDRGHWSDIMNFHGSPAPWILIGILLVAGLLHLQAEGKFGARV